MTRLKICGLRRLEDITYANELKPDLIGFVFAAKSKRLVSFRQAAELRKALSAEIQAVGVFVNEQAETVAKLLNSGVIDLAQLHGRENRNYIRRLRQLTDKPIIQAFRIASQEDTEKARDSIADYVLLDNGMGGTGEQFDWSLVTGFDRPYFLAGGLSPDNVAVAIDRCQPFAVDASSGLETNGNKDYDKMKRFVDTVRLTR
ncbi:phosphoribosylanthranilate isomerase [Alkalibaculum bacchi]|uniref:N-(5'-phosphoribosyl)anthranilate isomerase n=1 Tax=Alkalibaculum bacchi TaxID=645887 RepID=A0A366I9Y3_9FIRM|nr:phosphoribosylanthranilate isomerase [Alkalibaculum bacchi]RBP66686.1 phosphoribosylanthranilate isomerase [Alkalibaculum bacchi]